MNVFAELFLALVLLGLVSRVLVLNLWRALLVFAPSNVLVRPVAPADRMELPLELGLLAGELRALGFLPLGSHEEKPRLRRKGFLSYDFAHPGERVFATLHFSPDGKPRLYLLTPLAPEGFVLTAGYRRPTFEVPGRYRSGGLVVTSAEHLLRTHRERLQGLNPTGDFSWDARVRAGQAWYQGLGQTEVRRQNLQGLLWTIVALILVAGLFLGGRRPA